LSLSVTRRGCLDAEAKERPQRAAGETMAALAADYEVGEATIFRALQGPFEQAA
jgi:hypothetical protein